MTKSLDSALLNLDFVAARHLSGSRAVSPSTVLTFGATDGLGLPILQRGTTNLLPNSQQWNATVGLLNSGGALGPGWEQGNTAVPMRILRTTTTTMTLAVGPFPSLASTVIRTRTSAPIDTATAVGSRGQAVFSADIAVDTTSSVGTTVNVGLAQINPTATNLGGRSNLGPGQAARLVVAQPASALGTNFDAYIAINGTTGQIVYLTIANPQLESAIDVRDATDYVIGTRPADPSAILGLADGNYLAQVTSQTGAEWIPITSTGGSAPVATDFRGSLHVRRLVVYPSTVDISAYTEAPDPAVFKDFIGSLNAPNQYAPPTDPAFGRVQKARTQNRIANGYSIAAALNRPSRFRFEVRPGDNLPVDGANGNTNERAEVYFDSDRAAWDTDIWVDHRFRFINSLVSANPAQDFRIIQQWRYTPESGETSAMSPDVSLSVNDDGSIYLTTRSGTMSTTTTPATDSNSASTSTTATVVRWSGAAGTILPGVWYQHLYRIRFSATTNGALESYFGPVGATVQKFNGAAPIGYVRTSGPTCRMGVYRHVHPTETTILDSVLEFGSTSFASRRAAPVYP